MRYFSRQILLIILIMISSIMLIKAANLTEDMLINDLYTNNKIELTKSDYEEIKSLDNKYNEYGFCIIEPFTGEIKIMKNKNIIMERYFAPGSIVKIFSLIALEKSNQLNTNFSFRCKGYLSEPMQCWLGKGHGTLNLTEAIANSCNVYFYNMLFEAGFSKKSLENTVRIFNFKYNEDKDSSIYEEGIGYGIAVRARPIDIIYAFAAIYNGGLLNDENSNSKVIEMPTNDLINIIRDGMRGSYIYGTASPVMKKTGITDIAVKTGTAVTIENGRENPNKFTGISVMLYPSVKPQIALIIAIEKGRSSTACEISEIILKRFLYRVCNE